MAYNVDFDYIIHHISNFCEFLNEKLYYDNIHDAVNDYVVHYDYEIKEIVDKYGVFKAIQLRKDSYGEFEIDKNENKNYMTLGYVIISEEVKNKYPENTDIINAIDECDRCTTDKPCRCDGGCNKIVGYGRGDHDCKRACDNCEDCDCHSDSDTICEKTELTNDLSKLAILV